MTDINVAIKWFVENSITREQLKDLLEQIGLDYPVVQAYLRNADERKKRHEQNKKVQSEIDACMAIYNKAIAYYASPSGSLDEGR